MGILKAQTSIAKIAIVIISISPVLEDVSVACDVLQSIHVVLGWGLRCFKRHHV